MHKTAYELRISDWSSDVCSSDLLASGYRTRPAFSTSSARSTCRRAIVAAHAVHTAWLKPPPPTAPACPTAEASAAIRTAVAGPAAPGRRRACRGPCVPRQPGPRAWGETEWRDRDGPGRWAEAGVGKGWRVKVEN